MRAPGDRSLGLAGVRPLASDVWRAPRVRERVNERFLANTLRGVSSSNARSDARRAERQIWRAEGERPGGAAEDASAVGKKRPREGDDEAGKHSVDDLSVNPAVDPAVGFREDPESDERLAALLGVKKRRARGAAPSTGGYALIPEPEHSSPAADHLRSLPSSEGRRQKQKQRAERKEVSKKERKSKKKKRERKRSSSRG
jgi:hypothetical protein